nr:methyltransferase [Lysinibacillus timonensis]
MKERFYEELLDIRTTGCKGEVNNSTYYHPYEPTPYSALEELIKHYDITAQDHLVDFGCGKGRLNFFIHYLTHAFVSGIEMNEEFYEEAMKNRMGYLKKMKITEELIHFHCCKAEQYQIQPEDNIFYFFNPFSIQIFIKIINNILHSFDKHNRQIDLILYYASDDYRYYLNNRTSFDLLKEIKLPGLYEKNTYERFLIYRLDKVG